MRHGDGWLDAAVSRLGESPLLLLGRPREGVHWLRVAIDGAAVGVEVEAVAGGRSMWNHTTRAVGYASSSEPVVHFGLGAATTAARVTVRWPDGATAAFERVKAGQVLRVKRADARR